MFGDDRRLDVQVGLGRARAELVAGDALVDARVRALYGDDAQVAVQLVDLEAAHQRRLDDQLVLQPVDLSVCTST